jgi:hypothetical protein
VSDFMLPFYRAGAARFRNAADGEDVMGDLS